MLGRGFPPRSWIPFPQISARINSSHVRPPHQIPRQCPCGPSASSTASLRLCVSGTLLRTVRYRSRANLHLRPATREPTTPHTSRSGPQYVVTAPRLAFIHLVCPRCSLRPIYTKPRLQSLSLFLDDTLSLAPLLSSRFVATRTTHLPNDVIPVVQPSKQTPAQAPDTRRP